MSNLPSIDVARQALRVGCDFRGRSLRKTFDVHMVTGTGKKRARVSPATLWRWLQIAALAGVIFCNEGCDTPYTRRIHQLDEAYQRGDLSREDYMRFVQEADQWERK